MAPSGMNSGHIAYGREQRDPSLDAELWGDLDVRWIVGEESVAWPPN